MVTASILPPAKTQFSDANGDPLAGGSVYFYIPNTLTPKNTWQDPNQMTLNTNPVILDSAGEAIIYGSGQYRQQVYDQYNNLIWDQLTADSISNITGGSNTFTGNNTFTGTNTFGTISANVLSTNSTTARSLAVRFADPENVLDFGADPTGVADSTTAIQAAINQAGIGGNTYLPAGTYFVSATLLLPSNATLMGAGVNSTKIFRTGNYGNTLTIGTNSIPARAARVRDIWFQHGTTYVTGNSSLDHLATNGAHIYVIGSQYTKIENCWLQRLPYQIYFSGGSWQTVERCEFSSTYDYLTPALQEGIANIALAVDATYGNPTSVQILNNEILGSTVVRNVAYVASDRTTTVNNLTDTIGAQFGLLVQGGEDLLVDGNYFGGMSVAEIAVINVTGSACINHRIVNNFFDGISRGEQILYAPSTANLFSLEVTIADNNFVSGFKPIYINENVGTPGPSAYNVTITGNNIDASIATPILLNGCVGFVLADNVISNYNVYNVSLADLNYTSAALINGYSSIGVVSSNIVGGGGNTFSQSSSVNFCYTPIVISGVSNIIENGTVWAGIGLTGTTPQLGLVPTSGVTSVIGVLKGANFNVTTDQAIPINIAYGTKYAITDVWVTNSSLSLTTAVGGVYNAASKGGVAIVAAGQVYSACTSSGAVERCTIAAAGLTNIFTSNPLYLSLTTPQGAAATADIYVRAVILT